jgi:hypothetical protein
MNPTTKKASTAFVTRVNMLLLLYGQATKARMGKPQRPTSHGSTTRMSNESYVISRPDHSSGDHQNQCKLLSASELWPPIG